MTVFWILAALMILATLAFVLLPLFRRSPSSGLDSNQVNVGVYRDELAELESDFESGGLSTESYREAHAELERNLLDDVAQPRNMKAASTSRSALAAVIGLAVPLCAISLYWLVGSPGMLSPQAPVRADDLLQQIEQHLEKNPSDAEGWSVLARAYQAMERYSDASAAFEKASALAPDNAQVLADHADALARASGGVLEGKPSLLLTRALKIDPKNIKALALAGAAAYDAGDHKRASDYWGRLLAQLPPGSEEARIVEQRIAEARSQAAAGSSEAIRGTVKLSPQLKNRVAAEATLFVYAQSDDSKMPLAIVRARAKELPFSFVLDDAKGMAGGIKLSSADEVRVVARISKSGQAKATAGDIQGVAVNVKPGAKEVEIVIDQVITTETNK